MTHRSLLMATALAAGSLVVAGCGGDGAPETIAKAAAPSADGTRPAAAVPSAGDAIALVGAVGVPGPVNPEHVAVSLDSFERFGSPADPFKPDVKGVTPGGTGNGNDPFGAPPTSPTDPGGTPTVPTDPVDPTPTPTDPPASNLEADFEVAGEPAVVRVGDLIPPDTGELKVLEITSKGVKLQIVTGVLPDGTDTFSLGVGRTISLRNKTTGDVIAIRLKAVRTAGTPEAAPTP